MLQHQKNFWNVEPSVAKFLNLLIKDRKYKTVLEIGTSNGYSSLHLAKALKQTKGHLYTMESHKERFLLAQKNFKKSKLTNHITQIFGHAPEKIPKTPRHFDMAFFDATKYEHPAYFGAIKNRIKKSGLIITDNSNSHRKELAQYFKIMQKSKGWTSFELNIGDGLLVSLKIP